MGAVASPYPGKDHETAAKLDQVLTVLDKIMTAQAAALAAAASKGTS